MEIFKMKSPVGAIAYSASIRPDGVPYAPARIAIVSKDVHRTIYVHDSAVDQLDCDIHTVLDTVDAHIWSDGQLFVITAEHANNALHAHTYIRTMDLINNRVYYTYHGVIRVKRTTEPPNR